jgi:iron(III) transport system permease protein
VPSVLAQGSGIDIMSVQIVTLLTADFPPAYGPAIVLSLIMVGFVGVAWYAQTRILRRGRHSMVGGRARQAARASLGRWKWPVRALLIGYIGVVTVLPPIALLLVAMSGFWNPDINWSHLSFAPFRQAIFDNPQTLLALKDSLGLATAGATIAMIAAGLVSVLLVRSRGKLLRTADGALKLPVIVSHVVLAIGFVLAFAGAPFNLGGSWLILCITYVVLFMPQGTLATDAAAGQVGRELTEASQISGGGGWRTFRKVFLPLMMPSLAAGWAMLFVFILGDLEVSSLLAGASNPTIGMQALSLYDQGGYADVAALALVLVVVSTAIVAVVFTLARRRSKWALAQTASTPVMF